MTLLSPSYLIRMENRPYSGIPEMYNPDKHQEESNEALSDSLLEDMIEDFRLPIDHRPTENLDTEDLEQASLDTKLTSSNIGFRLLQKMGWKGKGLGKDEQGIIEPIKAGIRDPKLGVGKQEQDDFFTAEENVQRKKLEIEVEETEEHARKREVVAERELKIQSEVKEINKAFFCNLCNKQYKLAMEFEVHLSSYDHNHRKRFKEMKEMHSTSSRDDRQKREQARQEKEMAKFAQMYPYAGQRQQQQQEQTGTISDSQTIKGTTAVADPDQRRTLKFGFSARLGATKLGSGGACHSSRLSLMKPGSPSLVVSRRTSGLAACCSTDVIEFTEINTTTGGSVKKPKVAPKITSVFGDDSEGET
ncbi:hypothetical protein Taro_019239 [Colocasia esculenta]|uniref:G-patch domain-containing protein n=1 Tax=Colocasia esculenta TaxID=4460 RepID=A0A843UYN3_COLES|nr:hypothetical protein [Colocasia esculenta]